MMMMMMMEVVVMVVMVVVLMMRRVCVLGVSDDSDCQTNGQQELSGEEPGSSGNSRLNVDDLLRQDRHTDAEPHDCCSHVVRQQGL